MWSSSEPGNGYAGSISACTLARMVAILPWVMIIAAALLALAATVTLVRMLIDLATRLRD